MPVSPNLGDAVRRLPLRYSACSLISPEMRMKLHLAALACLLWSHFNFMDSLVWSVPLFLAHFYNVTKLLTVQRDGFTFDHGRFPHSLTVTFV